VSALVSRPTENAAIGLAMRARPPRLHVPQLLLDRAACATRNDKHGYYLLGGRLNRALGNKTGE
jgi:hypothetical protein